jgi:hypothetical protein
MVDLPKCMNVVMKCASVNIWNKNYVLGLSKTERNWLLFAITWVHPPFFVVSGFIWVFLGVFLCVVHYVLSNIDCPF